MSIDIDRMSEAGPQQQRVINVTAFQNNMAGVMTNISKNAQISNMALQPVGILGGQAQPVILPVQTATIVGAGSITVINILQYVNI